MNVPLEFFIEIMSQPFRNCESKRSLYQDIKEIYKYFRNLAYNFRNAEKMLVLLNMELKQLVP